MTKGFAIHNAPTDHGGLIPATQMRSSQQGNLFVRAGDGHYCPRCQCWSTVIKSHDHVIFDGKPVAYVGDKLTCGAKIMLQQSHVVGDGGGARGASQSRTAAVAQILKNIKPIEVSQSDLISNFSKVPKQPLTEEDKILTSEECRAIAFMLWGEQQIAKTGQTKVEGKITELPELSLDVRKEMTRIYFSAVDADDSMGYIESILSSFGSVTNKAAAKIITGTIIKDIAEMKTKDKIVTLWNKEPRQKYFKVGSSDNPISKFNDLNMAVKKEISRKFRAYYELEFQGNVR